VKKILVALRRAVLEMEEIQILSFQKSLGEVFVRRKGGDPGGV